VSWGAVAVWPAGLAGADCAAGRAVVGIAARANAANGTAAALASANDLLP